MLQTKSESFASFFAYVGGFACVVAVLALIAIVGLIAQASNVNEATVSEESGTSIAWIITFVISLVVWFSCRSIVESLRPDQPIQVAEIAPEEEQEAQKKFLNSPSMRATENERREEEQNERELQKEKILAEREHAERVRDNERLAEEKRPDLSFLREKYDELIRFKSNADFPKWGLSIGGPYNGWNHSVHEAYRQRKPIDVRAIDSDNPYVPSGVGYLLSLGQQYAFSKGKETKVTEFYKEEIEKILSGNLGPEVALETKRGSKFAEFQFIDADGFPDVFAFFALEQISSFYKLDSRKPNYSLQERKRLGIELLETKTRVKVHSQVPEGLNVFFEVTPQSGRHEGKRMFVGGLDLHESLR